MQSNLGQRQVFSGPQQPERDSQYFVENGILMPQLNELRVLFAIQGSRQTLELAQIDTVKHTQDDSFFSQMKEDYKEHRGFFRYWLSFWRFRHCTFVKVCL